MVAWYLILINWAYIGPSRIFLLGFWIALAARLYIFGYHALRLEFEFSVHQCKILFSLDVRWCQMYIKFTFIAV